jgi:plastocyanin
MPGTRWLIIGSLMFVALLTWLGGASQPAFAQDHGEVTIVDFAFEPATLEVSAGATVSWTNTGEVVHTVTADNGSFNSGEMSPGATVTGTFDTPGTYTYHCSIHPDMTGTLIVTAAEAAAPAATEETAAAVAAPASTETPVIQEETAAAPTTEAAAAAKDKGKDKDKDASAPSQPVKETKLAGVGVGTGLPHNYPLVALAAAPALLFALASHQTAGRKS